MPGAETMGRPKKGEAKASGPNKAADDREVIVHLKGSTAYAEWLDAIHRKTHIPKTSIFRLAVAEWAERNGHPAPPEM
jgi:hypothetical protein